MLWCEIMQPFVQTIRSWIFQPVIGSLLTQRSFCRIAVCVSICHILLSASGWHLWTCPFIATFGLPCPGCGLTRSIRAVFRGDIALAMQYHAFAAVAILTVAVLGVSTVLPHKWHQRLVELITNFEKKTGLSQITLGLLCLYWAVRILVADSATLMMLRQYG